MLVFLLIFVLVALLGLYNYRDESRRFRDGVNEYLHVVVTLKAEQMSLWLNERKQDILFLSQDPLMVRLFERLESGEDLSRVEERILEAFETMKTRHDYSVIVIFAGNGSILLSTATGEFDSKLIRSTVEQVATEDGPRFTPIHRGEDGGYYVHLIAPVHSDPSPNGKYIVTQMRATDVLLPLVRTWPTPSPTAECIVVQRDASGITYLGGLRDERYGDFMFRRPVDDPRLISSQIVSHDNEILEGLDYRGQEVLAAVKELAGTPWLLIAKIDKQEILHPIRSRAIQIALSAVVVIALGGVVLYGWWRRLRRQTLLALTTSDVALRKELERREVLEDIVQHSPAFAFIWSLEDGWPIEYVSESIHLLGYRADDLMNNRVRFDEMVHPEDLLRISEEVKQQLDSGAMDYTQEYRLRSADGSWRWMDDRTWVKRDAEGRIIQVQGILLDITTRKEFEAKLRHLAMAVEQTHDSIVITDVEGRIEYVNPAFCRVTGYERSDLLGEKPSLLKSGHQSEAYYKELWETILAGTTWTGELVNRRKDGTIFHEQAAISPIRDDQGKIVQFVGIKRDITREKELEQQFLQAQKMEAVGRLAGGVAHDFNNLLTAMIGYSELLLKDGDLSEAQRTDLAQIHDAGGRAKELTRQLLLFSRKQEVDLKVLDINEQLKGTLSLFQRMVGEDIQVDLALSPTLWRVRADPGQFDQVLLNLVVNARDAMPEGGRITIGTKNVNVTESYLELSGNVEGQAGRFVRVSVTDTGSGIEPDVLSHIFEPFYTTKKQGEGTGLGLSTVYGIMKQHQGWVHAYSERGQGAVFHVYFPEWHNVSNGAASPPAGPGVPIPGGQGERILVLEDEPGARSLALRVLRAHGYDPVGCGTLEEARELLHGAGARFKLVLSDVVLPDGNGFDFSREAQAVVPSERIILTSGYTDDRARRTEIDRYGYRFLAKPYAIDDLLGQVHEALGTADV